MSKYGVKTNACKWSKAFVTADITTTIYRRTNPLLAGKYVYNKTRPNGLKSFEGNWFDNRLVNYVKWNFIDGTTIQGSSQNETITGNFSQFFDTSKFIFSSYKGQFENGKRCREP